MDIDAAAQLVNRLEQFGVQTFSLPFYSSSEFHFVFLVLPDQ